MASQTHSVSIFGKLLRLFTDTLTTGWYLKSIKKLIKFLVLHKKTSLKHFNHDKCFILLLSVISSFIKYQKPSMHSLVRYIIITDCCTVPLYCVDMVYGNILGLSICTAYVVITFRIQPIHHRNRLGNFSSTS